MVRPKLKRLKVRFVQLHRKRNKYAIPIFHLNDFSLSSSSDHYMCEESDDLSFDSQDFIEDMFPDDSDDDDDANYSSSCSEDGNVSDEEIISENLHDLNLEIEIMDDCHEALFKFPLDIFLDIMARLPVRVLAQCRSVCKTWLKVIHHHRFVAMHHTRSVQSVHFSSAVIIPIKCYKRQSVNKIVVINDDNYEDMTTVEQRIGSSNFQFEIVGSCHGLLCLYEQVNCEIYIANPVVGEYVMLPRAVISKLMDVVFGFGYDRVCNEYKVIRLVFEIDAVFSLKGEIYGLRSGVWRSMGDISYPLRASSSPIFLNGALHWLTDEYAGASCTELIIALDVSKEEFFSVPPPPGFKFSSENYRYNLGELKGNLCFFYWSADDVFEIWIMNTYGVKDSWTKDYILSEQDLGRDSLYIHPMTLLENDELLLEYNNESLLCYNKKYKNFRELDPQQLPSAFDSTIHVESLVSLRDLTGATTSKFSGSRRRWYRRAHPIPSQQPA